jgi:hypothetical protein
LLKLNDIYYTIELIILIFNILSRLL